MKYYAEFEIPNTPHEYSGVIDFQNHESTIEEIEQTLAKNFDVESIKLLHWSRLH